MLNSKQLAEELRNMYVNAPNKEKKLRIVLFAIKFSDDLRNCGASMKEIQKEAFNDIETIADDTYKSEINLGRNLAKYVIEKK